MLFSAFSPLQIEAGVDEAGRGCLAGPVVAAAVILPKNYTHSLLNDSKKLSATQRDQLAIEIRRDAVAWAVAEASQAEIDEINILQASFLAMHRAIAQLKTTPELLLIDGNRFKMYENIAHHCIVKGDSLYLAIAAASVLAKTHRDEVMHQLAQQFPVYGWEKNAGYPTKMHRKGIEKYGLSPHHRLTFKVKPTEEQDDLT